MRTSRLKQGEYMRTDAGVYLVSHQLFAGKILDIYIGLMNPNDTFWLVFVVEVLGCYRSCCGGSMVKRQIQLSFF